MIRSSKNLHRVRSGAVVQVAVAMTVLLGTIDTAIAARPDEFRAMTAVKKFSGTEWIAAAYRAEAPAWLHAHHLETSVGLIERDGDARILISAGPAWRLQAPGKKSYVQFSISPTLFSGSRLGDRTLGGVFHFTSAIAVGHEFDSRWSLEFRVQHSSNAGLNSTNPGLDMAGISFGTHFGK